VYNVLFLLSLDNVTGEAPPLGLGKGGFWERREKKTRNSFVYNRGC